jgi:hypothetical protein
MREEVGAVDIVGFARLYSYHTPRGGRGRAWFAR